MHVHHHCQHGPDDDDDHDRWHTAVEAAMFAFLSEIGADAGDVVTVRAQLVPVEDSDDTIAEIKIGMGPDAHAVMAAEHAADELNRPGAPWTN